MYYLFQPMTQRQAEEIAQNWHYEGDYSFYDMAADPEDLAEFLDAGQRKDAYFTVHQDGEMVGFYSFTQTSADTVDIGLGMKPELTGKGIGREFLKAGLKFAESAYRPDKITLSVAAFNKRAITLYRNSGFNEVERFAQATNGSTFEFVKMIYHCGTTN
ncbi:GNAT family N-acetyltransferase [Planococcus salinarum]|uniref:GNAT family N-acetyltransferase n=1 Tax=Planococcus salinarum TaxID=622695 RepID=UPI000E3DD76A|nr:GNAT family protein [Planococcus salinarum]TAA67464.1 N-acetyltransferase [Planococcus salinarum]